MNRQSLRQALVGLVLAVALGFVGYVAAQPPQPAPVRPAPQAPAVNPAPARPFQPPARRPRGARPSPRHKIFSAPKHVPQAAPSSFTPAVILTPSQMSYWGNDQYGDCVTAEEFFAKDAYPVWYSGTGKSVDLPTSLAVQWAGQGGFLNGANLTDVMDAMAKTGVTYNGTTYTDGPYQSVDYTNWTTLCSAIYQGPVKIGVASSQFDNVAGVGQQNGWVMTGFQQDNSEDHCVSLCGYGTMQQLASAMGVTLPSGVSGSANGLLLFTWDTIGIIDFTSMTNITGEAWLRTPTTPQTPPPNPTPAPTPTPTPTPIPTPTPSGLTFTLGSGAPAGATMTGAGLFNWPAPTAGSWTVAFTVSAPGAISVAGSFPLTGSSATHSITLKPIPAQAATVGEPFTLDLSNFVTQSAIPGHVK